MHNSTKLLFLILLAPLFSIAQSSYQPAIAVNLKGETLHGFINYSEWQNNPRSISFKSTENGAAVKLTPNDLKYFSVSVGHLAEYQRYEGPVTMNNIEINNLPVGRDSSFVLDTVFLKVLQKGNNLSLFSYSDNFKTRFFISENSGQPQELTYRIYYNSNDENGRDRTVYETSYKGQLYDAAVKAGKISASLKSYIQKADYKEESLLYIAGKINGISDADPTKNNVSKPKKFNIAFAIVGAILVIVGAIVEYSKLPH